MKICLATQHCTAAFIPLALLYLKASLVEREGHAPGDVRILEFDPKADVDQMAREIVAAEPDVLGLSCYVWNVTNLLKVAAEIKARRPSTRIVLGGPEVGPVAHEVIARCPSVDVIVLSEGEVPLGELIRAWGAEEPLDGVRGILFRGGDTIVETPEALLVTDLDDLPSPHLHRYADYTGRVICIETQRGCVFRCNFCFYNKDFSLRNRRFGLERVKQEILFWLGQDVAEIYLMDPVFNLNGARAKEICRFIAEHNQRRIPVHAEIWAEFVDEEMARLMHEANFEFLEVGLQTTDTTALATVERRLKVEPFLKGIAHLKRHDLYFELQLIYGLPGETRASFRRSLNFAMSLEPRDLAVFRLMVLPGTELWRKADALTLAFEPEPPYFARSHLSMSEEDFAYGRRFAEACTDLQASRTARILSRERGLSFADLADEWVTWQSQQRAADADGERLPRFVAHVCEQNAIPPSFYERSAALESGARP